MPHRPNRPLQNTARARAPLYTAAERARRDASKWTVVQGVLAPLQFLVFAVSVALVLRFLATGEGFFAATVSILVKTLVLYTIMVTGALWEHDVFGRYLFAPAFFWEDAVSFIVITLHTVYLFGLLTGALDARQQMYVALAAYVTYLANAGQFLLKLRTARLEAAPRPARHLARSMKFAE
jgi:3-vinyl bacteriochlorophyllide hydratase